MKKIFIIITVADGQKMSNQLRSKVSVIIRNKNEEKWIGHCIQSIIDKIYKPEIIVINNNSNDNSLNIVKTFIQDPQLNLKPSRNYTDIKIYDIKDYTPGKALNLGVLKSTRKYILIISAHCVLRSINLNQLIINSKKYSGIFGNQVPFWNGKRINKRYLWSHFIEKKKINMFSQLENRYFFHNAVSFFEKKTLKKYPFFEKLVGKEDRYWINNLIKNKKLKSLYDPTLQVDHHYTENGNTWKGIG